MTAGRRRLFVYYRLTPLEATAALPLLARAQQALMAEWPGLQARLLRRPPQPDRPVTLMETYEMDAHTCADGVGEELQRRIEERMAAVLAGRLDGDRHVEVFETCV